LFFIFCLVKGIQYNYTKDTSIPKDSNILWYTGKQDGSQITSFSIGKKSKTSGSSSRDPEGTKNNIE